MKKPLHITIPTPCHEKWADMTPTEKGAFCAACKKEVVDFTRKTQNEIYDIVSNGGDNMCGRFFATQIEESIVRTEINPSLFNWRAIAASLAALVVGNEISAASFGNKTYAPTLKAVDTASAAFCETIEAYSHHNGTKIKLKGFVFNGDSLTPIGSALVRILGSIKRETQTDSAGYFEMEVTRLEEKRQLTVVVEKELYGTSYFGTAIFSSDTPNTIYIRKIEVIDVVVVAGGVHKHYSAEAFLLNLWRLLKRELFKD